MRFNPRLTSAARRTIFTCVAMLQNHVSIRASLQQRGEQVVGLQVGAEAEFQSAPHFSSEANGVGLPTLADIIPFQSAPHFRSEANTNFGTTLKDEAGVSIRASLQQRGERR